jgi:hypothetical protein
MGIVLGDQVCGAAREAWGEADGSGGAVEEGTGTDG